MSSSFETTGAAKKRKLDHETSDEGTAGKRQRKNHCGNFNRMTWDKEALKREVETYKDGDKVNWSELARRYNVTNRKGEIAKNGGQIVQDWLVSQGVNLHRFKKPQEISKKQRVRRKKKRGQGGEISIPVPETNAKLQEQLKLKILSGEYTVGELIVPRKVTKMI